MRQSQPGPATDQDLVQLKPDTDSVFARMIGPKVIILTFLSLIFISRNLYTLITQGMPDLSHLPQPQQPGPEQETIYTRMHGYLLLTVVLFGVYWVLARVNDNAMLRQREREETERQQQRNEEQGRAPGDQKGGSQGKQQGTDSRETAKTD